MTDTELVGQATILFGASFETTASTLTWTVFLLAQHPAIMAELMDELDRVLGGNAPTRDQLAQLSFLDRVIKESMRILPPVPFTIRAADDDAINEERSPFSEQRSARSNSPDGEVTVATRVGTDLRAVPIF